MSNESEEEEEEDSSQNVYVTLDLDDRNKMDCINVNVSRNDIPTTVTITVNKIKGVDTKKMQHPFVLLLFIFVFVAIVRATDDRWIVQLEKGVSPYSFGTDHHLKYVGPFGPLQSQNYHVFKQQKAVSDKRVGAMLDRSERVLWHEKQVERMQYKRSGGDPLYENQWHLKGDPLSSVDADKDGHSGRGVTIGIVDDGLQTTHPEIKDNFDSRHSWDYNGNKYSPDPSRGNGHGTSAAAVAAGVANNNHCGRGVAPNAKLVGLRTIAEAVSDATEAQALSHYANTVDIYSCSWGPRDSGDDMVGPGSLVQNVLSTYAGRHRGRGGKGSVYVWASGNGAQNSDSCAYDGYAGSPYVFAIGAINSRGQSAYYSEGCANLIAVTPSSGRTKGITTADLLGNDGYDSGECTAHFGGTSSATPLAAGIFARILEARPQLTWRDLMHVVASGATQINPTHYSWNTNAARYHHSNVFGFGLLKIPALIRTAKNHHLVPSQKTHSSGTKRATSRVNWKIPNVSGRYLEVPITLLHTNIRFIEHVLVKTYLVHGRRGEVGIRITSPSNTLSVLTELHEDHHKNFPAGGWMFSSLSFWGETKADGTWKLTFADLKGGNAYSGHVEWIEITILGY